MLKQNVAVIGSGIAGLSASWLLSKSQNVTLFEAAHRLGGHANTVDIITPEGSCPVDTGFIVYNENTYPNLIKFLDYLSVETEPSSMTFAASFNTGEYEYSGTHATGLFAQKRNLFSAAHWQMIFDITRFFRNGPNLAYRRDNSYTLANLLNDGRFSESFIRNHIIPMGACIWSNPISDVLEMPARAFVEFFDNHGLLKVANRPQWRTVSNGSRSYIEKLSQDWSVNVQVSTPVKSVYRTSGGVEIATTKGMKHHFDHVVIACHSTQALDLLVDPSRIERELIGAFKFSPNQAVLHTDCTLMPRRRAVWSSWNYLEEQPGLRSVKHSNAVSLTYWMNALQNLPTAQDVFVTLNPGREVDPAKTIAKFDYQHPVFDGNALNAQQNLWSLQGQNKTWFCGAWFGAGFHEDGLQAGLAVAEQLGGLTRPWNIEAANSRIHVTPAKNCDHFLEAAE
jgi:predicted NAD/FAD-binding protein